MNCQKASRTRISLSTEFRTLFAYSICSKIFDNNTTSANVLPMSTANAVNKGERRQWRLASRSLGKHIADTLGASNGAHHSFAC